MVKTLILSFLTLIISSALTDFFVSAREPAVEPIRGIAIDHFKPVSPTNIKGYDFSAKDKVTETSTAPYWLLLTLFLCPFAIASFVSVKLRKNIPVNDLPLTYLHKRREELQKRKEAEEKAKAEEETKWPKAS